MPIPLDNLIRDDVENGIFRVHRSVFTSDEILQLEQERIFNRTWLYLGHESEVPKVGNFVRRTVAGRPLFFVRGEDGAVRVFYNTCTHRGALICRTDSGTAKVLQCFYHAWTFDTRGQLIGVPGEEAYSHTWDRDDRCLKSPPRVESYRGFIFVSFHPDVEDLPSHLAGACEYFDLVSDQSERGLRVVRGEYRYTIKANWKLLVENSVDLYHFPSTHQTYFEFLKSVDSAPEEKETASTRAFALGNGHAVTVGPAFGGRPVALWKPYMGEEARQIIERTRARIFARFGEARGRLICETGRNLLICPNLVLIDTRAIALRTFYPVRPDYLEVLSWELVPNEDYEPVEWRTSNFLAFWGPGGFATPDDIEALESCQAGFAATGEGWSDVSRGMHREARSDDELQMRSFWRKWHADIRGLKAPTRLADQPPGRVNGGVPA